MWVISLTDVTPLGRNVQMISQVGMDRIFEHVLLMSGWIWQVWQDIGCPVAKRVRSMIR